MRIYTPTFPRPFLPQLWCQAVGMRAHRTQADYLIVARTKADAEEFLSGCGISAALAKSLAMKSKVDPWPHSTPVRTLLEAGAVNMATPSVFVWNPTDPDSMVIRVVNPGGLPVTVGHFFQDGETTSFMTKVED